MSSDRPQISTRRKKKGKWQFSLLTLLLITAGVSCLASAYGVHRNDTQSNHVGRQCFDIGRAIYMFHGRNGRIPTQEEGLKVLTAVDANLGRPDLDPEDLVDVWGNKVVYTVLDLKRANGCSLRSFGPNGIDDGRRKDDIHLDDIYDVTAISRYRLQLVSWLCVASYIFVAIGIALEHGRRKAMLNGPVVPKNSEATP